MARIPIAVQLYSVREECQRDLPQTLAAVAKMGYEGVEFAGYYNYSAKELKGMLDDLGLKCAGTHTSFASIQGDELQNTIDFNKILDNQFLIVPWIGEEYRGSKEAYQRLGAALTEASDKAKAQGMQVGYHNHDFEFVPLENGELPFDIIFQGASPDVVMQVDTGNAMHGGGDPMPFFENYPGRLKTVHLKEFSKDNPSAALGEGDVPWQRVFEICESTGGTQWYIVEYEVPDVPPLQAIDQCLQNLKKMGK
jgi:sugar phosphate isomerase/epimerase